MCQQRAHIETFYRAAVEFQTFERANVSIPSKSEPYRWFRSLHDDLLAGCCSGTGVELTVQAINSPVYLNGVPTLAFTGDPTYYTTMVVPIPLNTWIRILCCTRVWV